jgi:DNA end-binding protein Ku
MPRLLWKGAINFGLVRAPIMLYPATKRDDIAFDLLDKRTLDPVGYKRVNKETGEEIEKGDIVRGYEYEDERYVLLSDDEIRSANVQSNHTVDVLAFVEAHEIPFLLFETPYYLAPAPGGEKVYALLRDALARTNKIGIVQAVVQTRQHLAALIAYGPVLLLNTLRWSSEVRPFDELDLPDENVRAAGISDKERLMTMQLVDSMTEKWDPARYRDTFRDDIMALIERKIKAGKTETVLEIAPPPQEEPATDMIDLTEILRRSLPLDLQDKSHRRTRSVSHAVHRERPRDRPRR